MVQRPKANNIKQKKTRILKVVVKSRRIGKKTEINHRSLGIITNVHVNIHLVVKLQQ